MKSLVFGTVLLASALAIVVPGTAASAATVAATGAMTVQLRTVDGAPADVPGVKIRVSTSIVSGFVGTTDGAGSIRFTGLPPASYALTVLAVPQHGTSTLALVAGPKQAVVAGRTTEADLDDPIGATLSGRLTKADGTPLAGAVVRTYETLDTLETFSATTDPAGRYTIVGLKSGVHRLTASATTDSYPAEWKASTTEQTATAPAVHTYLAPELVHSNYDVSVGIETERDPAAIAGAVVRATNTVTGVSYDEKTSDVADANQGAEWEIPSGTYTFHLITVATPTAPSQTWWLTSTGNHLGLHKAAAATFSVTYGTVTGASGIITPL